MRRSDYPITGFFPNVNGPGDFGNEASPPDQPTAPPPSDTARDAAKEWGKTVAGIFTVGGVLALIQGENKIGDLQTWAQLVFIGLLIAAGILAISAVLKAFLTAFAPIQTGSWQKVQSSIAQTIGAMALLTLATLWLWQPVIGKDDGGPQKVLLTYQDNTVKCSSDLTAADLTNVRELAEVDKCPTVK